MRTRSKFFWPALTVVTVMFTLSSLAVASLGAVAFAGTSPTISSDRPDYAPGDTVTLTGTGWDAQEAVHIFVNDNDGQTWSYNANVNADDQGSFTNSFQLPTWFVALYSVTATGTSSGTATTTFTDAVPPSSSRTFPVANTYYNAAGWNAGCTTGAGDFCGTATGGSSGGHPNTDFNVTGVQVSIQEGSGVNARYWNGGSFTSVSEVLFAATLDSSGHNVTWHYNFAGSNFTEENQYKVFSYATNNAPTPVTETSGGGTSFFIDNAAPSSSITCNAAACAGTYSGSVTVGLSATDPVLGGNAALSGSGVQQIKYTTDGSDPTSSGTASTISGASGSFSISATTTVKWAAYDNAGNVSSVQSQTITFAVTDSTTPTTTITLTPGSPNGSNGWYKTAVTVQVSAIDPDDSVAQTRCVLDPASVPSSFDDLPSSCAYTGAGASVSSDGTHTVYAASVDSNGNKESPVVSASFKLDKTGPSATLSVTAGTLGSNGWYTSDVTVHTSGSDAISDNVTCTLDQFQTAETTGTVFNGSCTNDAGVTTNAAPLTIKLDKTGPSATLSVTAGTLGSNGWYTSDVTVHTSGSDAISDNVTCTLDQFQTADTTGTTFNGSCTNDAGLTTNATALIIKLDKTAPVVTVTGFSNGHVYTLGDTLPTVGCSSSDTGGSGIGSTTGPTQTTFLSVNGVGTATFGCSATDNAGNSANASASYSVHYANVSGILQPINPDNTSVFKRGQAIPVKFMLAGDEFTGFNTSGWTIQKQSLTCGVFDGNDAILESVGSNTPSSYFRYDATADQYIYNADMHNLGVGTCWNFKVTLDSGQVLYSAVFKLTK